MAYTLSSGHGFDLVPEEPVWENYARAWTDVGWRGKKILAGVFLVTFITEGYTIIPITQLTDQLGPLNSHVGVILGLGAGGQLASTSLYAGSVKR